MPRATLTDDALVEIMTEEEPISEAEMDQMLRRMGWIKANEVAPGFVPSEPEPVPGVEYWNAERPNELLVIREPGPKDKNFDAATNRTIAFLAGYFRATEPWQIEAIEQGAGNRAFRADIDPTQDPLRCTKCGWESRSTRAMMYHVAQES